MSKDRLSLLKEGIFDFKRRVNALPYGYGDEAPLTDGQFKDDVAYWLQAIVIALEESEELKQQICNEVK